jgi:hypothetical protein
MEQKWSYENYVDLRSQKTNGNYFTLKISNIEFNWNMMF